MLRISSVLLHTVLMSCLCRIAHASWNVRSFTMTQSAPTASRLSIHNSRETIKEESKQTKLPSTAEDARPMHSSAWKKKIQNMFRSLNTGEAEPAPAITQQFLYWITALDAIQALSINDYPSSPLVVRFNNNVASGMVPNVYKRLFYFAKLRPRLLFSIGSLLRALQLCTPLRKMIDPSIGVGAGINMFAILCGSRWVKPLILGWTCTKYYWVWLGAKPIQGAHVTVSLLQGHHVPISLHSKKDNTNATCV